MGGWFEGLIHFIRGESHEITFISKFWGCLGGWGWSVLAGGGVAGAAWGCVLSCFQLG